MAPSRDDRTWADLVEEARARIPALSPGWTDHNPSDPGITLVELFAWLTEILLYRADQVTDDGLRGMLKILSGDPGWRPGDDLDEDVRRILASTRRRWRAVTPDDFEHLVLEEWPRTPLREVLATLLEVSEDKLEDLIRSGWDPHYGSPESLIAKLEAPIADLGRSEVRQLQAVLKLPELTEIIDPGCRVGRAVCVPRRSPSDTGTPSADVTLVVVPDRPQQRHPGPGQPLLWALRTWLDRRRLLGVRHQVIGPEYVKVTVGARLALQDAATETGTLARAEQALHRFFHPLTGGTDGRGWPLGRNVYTSEATLTLAAVPGVDWVEKVTLEPAERLRGDGIQLHRRELPKISAAIRSVATTE